jgi:glycosidase
VRRPPATETGITQTETQRRRRNAIANSPLCERNFIFRAPRDATIRSSCYYRIQFNPEFTCRDGVEILAYLRDLGISHAYASPLLASRKGSKHGCDVIGPTRVHSDLGGDEALAELVAVPEEHGMGLPLVPR